MIAPNPHKGQLRLSDVEPQQLEWLWPDRMALGKLTLLAGDPDLGKSFVTLDMASRVSTGAGWPDTPDLSNAVGSVILLSAEDDLADTIRPRLEAMGADLSRIIALQDSYDLKNLNDLESAIVEAADVRLVVIDPIDAYLGNTNSHNNAEVRGLLAPLAALASEYRVAIVLVQHLNKKMDLPTLYRMSGSIGFVATCRAVWWVERDKGDAERRLLMPVKNNLSPDRTGLAYRVVDSGKRGIGKVEWEPDPLEVTAADVFGNAGQNGGQARQRQEAAYFLKGLLANGPVLSTVVLEKANAADIAERTLNRAKQHLGVQSDRVDGKRHWQLPGGGA